MRQNQILGDIGIMNEFASIRVDHIGSLVRPAGLKEVLSNYDHGQVLAEEFRKVQQLGWWGQFYSF